MSRPATRTYAGPVSRAVAYGMDACLVAVLFSAAAAIAGLITSVLGTRWHEIALGITAAWPVALPAVLATYCTLFWALAGRTPGMAVLGLRVVATRPRALSWPAAMLRAVLLAFFPIGALWVLVDRRHQAVHDKIARTAVIRMPVRRADLTSAG